MSRPRVLYVTRFMPWPPRGGARLRNFHLLQVLSQDFDVDLLTVGRNQGPVARLCQNVLLPSPFYGDESPFLSFKRWGFGLLESMQYGQPLWLSSKTTQPFRQAARELTLSGEYDVIHAAELSTAVSFIGDHNIPLIYDAHNCAWKLLAERQAQEKWPASRILEREVESLKRVERDLLLYAKVILATSDAHKADLLETAGRSDVRIKIIPSSVDLNDYKHAREVTPEPRVMLIPGAFDRPPSIAGLEWFLTQVYPALVEKCADKNFEIVVAGRMDPGLVKRLDMFDHITPHPNPDKMEPLFARAAAVLVPVTVSSGTGLRIAEGLASKRPVVTTSAGALGIQGVRDRHWLLADEAEDFAQAVVRLMDEPGLTGSLTANGWDLVQALDWRAQVGDVTAVYAPLLEISRNKRFK